MRLLLVEDDALLSDRLRIELVQAGFAVDVVADGGYIPAGARVKVVLGEGNRIVVKEV
jgi:DNA-binding response OmpR family regulator